MLWQTAVLAWTQAVLAAQQPNILFIMTDDQDLHMNSVEHMPSLRSLIVDKGTTYSQHYCQVALCCPSRATLWTGRAAHNHNVTNVSPPHGGYPKVVKQGINDDNLFLWMQDAGYSTYYVGKLWNSHSIDNYNSPYARGFDGSDFLLDPSTYRYYDSTFTHNGGIPESYRGHYSVDVVSQKAQHWLATAHGQNKPFFLTVAPIAPHSNWDVDPDTEQAYLLEPRVADRHKHLFAEYQIPRDPSFNAAIDGGVSWGKDLSPLNNTVLAYNDHFQRQRLRSLQAVDEMIQTLISQLEATNRLDNTYIIFTTDNGYHISQHRMHPGKECGYDTDIHIPFFLRGPGIPQNTTISSVTSHTDVASTLLSLAGVHDKELDGIAMPLLPHSQPNPYPEPHPAQNPLLLPTTRHRHEHATIEYWGSGVGEGLYPHPFPVGPPSPSSPHVFNPMQNNTYKALRLINPEGQYSLYYSIWCTNETELYDLRRDPYQLVNLLATDPSAAVLSAREAFTLAGDTTKSRSPAVENVVSRLDALMMVLKSCKGRNCTRPWEVLHPKGGVETLGEAMAERYDEFYAGQPRMWFRGCAEAYWREWESGKEVRGWDGD
jgi:N-acetylglucosamine-6-sulfatase